MGHVGKLFDPHDALRRRLDKYVIGAPEAPGIGDILALLFDDDEAAIGARMPCKPARLERIAARCAMSANELRPKLETMADRGVVIDFVHPDNGQTLWALAPTVVGFVEFTMMRRRDDLPQRRLAALYEEYIHRAPFMQAAFEGTVQVGRALISETARTRQGDTGVQSEVVAYERASDIIHEARRRAVGLCACRHTSEHLGRKCDHAQETCISLNLGAEYVIRRGLGRELDRNEALEIVARAREAGLVQICDNVKQRPVFLCSCCSCCCDQLRGISHYGLRHAIVTSNFIAEVAKQECTGCGTCVASCPIGAIGGAPQPRDKHTNTPPCPAEVDRQICIGCGVCTRTCKSGALALVPRGYRVLTPETTLDRIMRMAIERGKLHHLVLEDHAGWVPDTLAKRLGSLLRVTQGDDRRVVEQLRSRGLELMFAAFRRTIARHVDWF